MKLRRPKTPVRFLAGILFSAFALSATPLSFGASVPALTDTINPLPGPACKSPLQIAVNNTTHRVYTTGNGVAFGSNGRVSVIDAQTNSVIAGFSLPWGVNDMAVNEATNKIYLGTYSGPDGSHLVPQIAVVDGATDQVTTFPGNLGTRVELDPVTGRLFATDYVETSVRVYDGSSLALLANIPLSNGGDSIRALKTALNPTARKLYVTNSSGNNLNVIGVIDLDQLVTRPFIHTSASDQTGHGNLVSDSALNKLFVGATLPDGAGSFKPAFLVIDCASDSITNTINLTANDYGVAGSTIYVGAALDAVRHRAYFSDDYYPTPRTVVLDTQNNSVLGSFGKPFTYGVILNSTGQIYATQYTTFSVPYWAKQNAIGAINPADGSVVKIVTAYQPYNVRLNPATDRIYVSDEKAGEVLVFNGADHSLVARVPVGTTDVGIRDLAVSAALNRFYLPRIEQINPDGTKAVRLDVFDGGTNQLLTTVTLATGFISAPGFVAVDDTRRRVYVSGQTYDGSTFHPTLFVLNADTNAVIATPETTNSINGLGVNPTTGRIYLATNSNGGFVQVLDPTSFAEVAMPSTGRVPGPMVFDPQHNRLYLANQGAGSVDNDVSVIDTTNDANIGTISNIGTQNSHAVTSVAVDPMTNTVYAGDNGNGFTEFGYVSAFDAANNYTYLGQTEVGRYPTSLLFNPVTHELFATNNETGTISVLGNGVPPGPPVPAHGGLSETFFRVNGSKNPSGNVADTVLHFSAQQSGTPAGLEVRVQVNTSPDNNRNDWVNLNNGTRGYMTRNEATGQFLLNSTNYPLTSGLYFRAISIAHGFPDSKSNVVGPFNLSPGQNHLGATSLYLAANGPGQEIKFRAAVAVDQATLTPSVQATTTPDDDASWVGLSDGRSGQMYSYDDHLSYYLDSTNYPPGDVVYFRVVAKAVGFVDSYSNIIGVRNVVVGTPPVVEVLPPPPQSGSQSGLDPDHPIIAAFGGFQIGATGSSPQGKQIKKIGLIYDESTIDVRENGAENITTQYTTTVPGDHVIKAFAIDERGITGYAAPVYIRIKPVGGKVFTMVNSGAWNNPANWQDGNGAHGVPGVNDFAVLGSLNASITQSLTAFVVSMNGGSITGAGGTLTITKSLALAAGQLKNLDLTIDSGAVMSLMGNGTFPMSGTLTNKGKLTTAGGTIIPVPTANRPALNGAGSDGFLDGVGLFFKNLGQAIFGRPAVKKAATTPPSAPVAVPAPPGAVVQKIENSGKLIAPNGGTLISPNGGTLIAPNGGTLIGQDGAGLISQDGGGVISPNSADLISPRGAGIIGNDGASLISQDGGGRPALGISSSGSAAETGAGFVQTGGETDLDRIQIISAVELNGGTLTGSGVIIGSLTNNGGFVSPGHSAGQISVTEDFTQESGGTLIVEQGGLGLGQADQLQVGGTANLGGSLHLRTINGFVPDVADTFSPLGFAAVSGAFASAGSNTQVSLNETGALVTVNPNAAQPLLGQPLNISTRMRVLTGDNVLIGGFIVTGPSGSSKKVMIRGLGPSLASAGLTGLLSDPLLELHRPDGSTLTNDNWAELPNKSEIPNGYAPQAKESVLIADLAPGNYTVIERGAHSEVGVGLTEIYDLNDSAPAQLGNIATRGFVDTGDNVMIGGFIIGGSEPGVILVRAIGPSLANAGLTGILLDPILELHDANGSVFINDNWRETQESEIIATTIPPSDNREPAILATLMPGNYTVIVRGKNETKGIGLVEVYKVK